MCIQEHRNLHATRRRSISGHSPRQQVRERASSVSQRMSRVSIADRPRLGLSSGELVMIVCRLVHSRGRSTAGKTLPAAISWAVARLSSNRVTTHEVPITVEQLRAIHRGQPRNQTQPVNHFATPESRCPYPNLTGWPRRGGHEQPAFGRLPPQRMS